MRRDGRSPEGGSDPSLGRSGEPNHAPPARPQSRSRLRRATCSIAGRLTPWLLLSLGGCDPFHTEFADVEPAERYRAARPSAAPATRDELVVMSYNLKFAGGRIDFFFDCHGDRVLMSRSEVETHLEGLARKIRQVDPDVLFVQEVDVNSKRSAFVDQLQWLLDHTELNHALYASQWRADFVPSDGIGAVDSGNAILSKHPLHEGTRLQLPLRGDQDAVERYFYLRRNLLRARLDDAALGEPVWLLATHTEAYSRDGTKLSHIERFERELTQLSERGLVLAGGDLNTLPPGSARQRGFEDSVCEGEFEADDFTAEGDWLLGLYQNYDSAIDLDAYHANQSAHFTHTTSRDGFWNRTLDYLFTNGSLEHGLVHQDESSGGMATMPLSDHAPLTAVLRARPSEEP